MVLEMMTNSWERGEPTDSLCGFIWLNLDEDEADKIFENFETIFCDLLFPPSGHAMT